MPTDAFDIEQDGQRVTVRVRDQDVSPAEFQEALDVASDHMRYDKAQHFIFDLRDVKYMPSACLGALLSFQQDVEHCRGRIALVHAADSIAALFRITQLDEVFGLFDEIEEAIAALSGITR